MQQKTLKDKLVAILKRKGVFIPLIIVALIALFVATRTPEATYEAVTVERGTLVQEVSVTGSVTPIDNVELSFERSGRIVEAPVRVGDTVYAGQTLLRLDATSDMLALRQAEAALAADEATLAQLRAGTRAEDLAVLVSKRDAAKASLGDSEVSLVDKIRDGYTRADDAVRNYADKFFDGPRTSDPQINIPVNDSQLDLNLGLGRLNTEKTLSELQKIVSQVSVTSDLYVAARIARSHLVSVADFLDLLASAVNSLSTNSSLSQTTIDTYRSQVSSARSTVNTALSGLSTGEDGYTSARFALDLTEKNLAVAIAGTAPEEIRAAEAAVLGSKANVDSLRHDVALASLRAPFAGVISAQDGKIGQTVSANTALVSLIGTGGFEIEANVPEADIAKLSAGQTARVTLDAYGSDEEFIAVISSINPAETLVDNVATYKVTLQFLTQDPRIRSGMTANVDILSAEKPDVVLVPVRAVVDVDGKKVVRVPQADGSLLDTEVEVGLKSSDGRIEIISGLSPGDTIAVGR